MPSRSLHAHTAKQTLQRCVAHYIATSLHHVLTLSCSCLFFADALSSTTTISAAAAVSVTSCSPPWLAQLRFYIQLETIYVISETVFPAAILRLVIKKQNQTERKQQYTHMHAFNGPLSGTTCVSLYYKGKTIQILLEQETCLLYTSPSPRDRQKSRMPSSA